MSLLPLPSQTLARLQSRAEGGHDDARVLLHLIARADKRDRDVAEFVDSYSSTIAALCRRLEAMERGANLQQRDEDAEAAQPDSVADTAQRITDYAAKAGLTVQDWAKAFNAAPVDDSPVANALLQAEADLVVAWLDWQGHHASANVVRRALDR
jgi:cell pole-organizing protein PopZ